jgi:uncharacterized membrane protein YsdA (DUF1294 family)
MDQTFFLQILLIIINGIPLVIFGIDKLKSKKGGRRIPESKLLLIAFFGPFGALAAMLLFRHKTRKTKFLLVPIFLFIQMLLLVYFLFPNFELSLNILRLYQKSA